MNLALVLLNGPMGPLDQRPHFAWTVEYGLLLMRNAKVCLLLILILVFYI